MAAYNTITVKLSPRTWCTAGPRCWAWRR